jgi:uncharacterized membrane protein YfcA
MPFNRPIPEDQPRRKPSAGIEGLVQAEKLMQMALLLPSSAFIGWLAGAWLDSHFHQSWMGIAGCVFGGISGLVYVVRLVITTEKNSRIEDVPQNGTGRDSTDNTL